MKHVTIRKNRARFLSAWIPNGLLALIDKAVEGGDTDRSSFVRRAVKEKVERTKISVAPLDEKA